MLPSRDRVDRTSCQHAYTSCDALSCWSRRSICCKVQSVPGRAELAVIVRRKSEELNECHELGESVPTKIDECDNFADPQTKYLTTKVWLRHLHYTHNISGEPPPVVVKNKKKTVSIDESNKE